MRPNSSSVSAFSLVELLIALGLGSILLVFISQLMMRTFKGDSQIDKQIDLASLKSQLQIQIHCARTRSAMGAGCVPGTAIAILGHSLTAPPLVAVSGSKIGGYFLSAQCTNWQNEIRVRYSVDNQSWSDLYEIPLMCAL